MRVRRHDRAREERLVGVERLGRPRERVEGDRAPERVRGAARVRRRERALGGGDEVLALERELAMVVRPRLDARREGREQARVRGLGVGAEPGRLELFGRELAHAERELEALGRRRRHDEERLLSQRREELEGIRAEDRLGGVGAEAADEDGASRERLLLVFAEERPRPLEGRAERREREELAALVEAAFDRARAEERDARRDELDRERKPGEPLGDPRQHREIVAAGVGASGARDAIEQELHGLRRPLAARGVAEARELVHDLSVDREALA